MQGRPPRRAPLQSNEEMSSLERPAQRELDETRVADGGEDSAERPADGPHVVNRRIGKIGMVPHVEEVGGKAELVPIGNLKVLDQRKVPILLVRPAIDIATKVSKNGHGAVPAQRGSEGRRGREVGWIQVTVVHATVNVSGGQAGRDGTARCERATESQSSQARAQKRRASGGIGHGEWRAGLE